MKQIKTYKGQSLTDIAVQEYGDISGIELLMEDNEIGLCDFIAPSSLLNIRDTQINKLVVEGLQNRNIKPNNDVSELHGLELWAIEVNFQIQ